MATISKTQKGYASTHLHETASLRLKFLIPIVAAIALLILTIIISLFYLESERQSDNLVHADLINTQSVAKDYYQKSISRDTKAIKAIMAALRQDSMLSEIFASYNRDALLSYTDELFQELKREYQITHFYFIQPDRKTLLRVHAPERFGDKIDRITTIWAKNNKTVVHGVELGVLGTFTLRVVSPWYDNQSGKLIGYVEMGMELDHVLDRIRESFGLEVAVVIYKEFLQQRKWTEGMRVLKRADSWDDYKSVILSSAPSHKLSPVLDKYLKQGKHIHRDYITRLEYEGAAYWLLSMPIQDAMGHDVATTLLLSDASSKTKTSRQSLILIGTSVFLIGSILIGFFYWQAGRLGKRIEQNEKILTELATHDSLTGLCTRRMFHHYLDLELAHSVRFTHPISLLLIDIDYFKGVNDNYGHQAGDSVLMTLSKRIQESVREVDHACRYGGEEIAVILPETDVNGAQTMAARLINTVSSSPFIIDEKRSLPITISIGIATYPIHADSDTALIAAADNALYEAKQAGRNRLKVYHTE